MKRTYINKVSKKHAHQKRNDDKLRQLCLIRSNGYCENCGRLPDWRGLSLHHIRPKKMGGTNHEYTLDEVELLCGNCHSSQHNIREL